MNTDQVFRFYLKKDDSTYYAIKSGKVITTATKTALNKAVSDWMGTSVSFKRSPTYWSAFREYTTPMTFVLNGAKIIRNIFYQQLINGSCIFQIEKLNTTTREYALWYSGDIDFSQINDPQDTISVNVLERGLVELLKNREAVVYEIPLDDPDSKTIQLPGILLGSEATWAIGFSDEEYTGEEDWRNNISTNSYITVFMVGSTLTQTGVFIIQNDQTKITTQTVTSFYNDGCYIAKVAKQLQNVTIVGNFNMGIELNDPGNHTIEIHLIVGKPIANTSGTIIDNIIIGSKTISGTSTQFINIPLSANINEIDANTILFLWYRINAPSGVTAVNRMTQKIDGSFLTMNFMSSLDSSTAKAFRYIDFAKKVVSNMTDGAYGFESDFLGNIDSSNSQRILNFDNSPYNTMITCGYGLRNIPGAVIKTTFQDMWKDCWSRWMLAVSVEGNTIRMEPLNYYFDDTELLHIKSINNFIKTPYLDVCFNTINIGYNSYDNQNIVGKNEFNTTESYLIKNMLRINTKDDCISPYRADIYGIESIRSQTFSKDRSDNESDNDIFLIEVDPVPSSGIYSPYKPVYQFISGVDDPAGVYNVALSPKRALYRHLPRIRSIMDSGLLQYQSTNKNPDLISDIVAGGVIESGNIDLAENPNHVNSPSNPAHDVSALFKPLVFTFDCVPPYNLSEILSLQTKGYISFTWTNPRTGEDVLLKGFILDVGCTPAIRDKYTFKLLSHPDNDLSKLE